MSIELYALANSRPPALHAVRTEPNLLQRLHPLSAPQRAELHFGRVNPVLQYGPGLFGALRIPDPSWNTTTSTVKEETTRQELYSAVERPWAHLTTAAYHRRFLGTATTLGTYLAMTTQNFATERHTIAPLPTRPPLVQVNSPKSSSPDAQSLLLIEQVKHMLDQQKVRDARRILEIGSIRYPASRQIVSLLQAISPGRVSSTGLAISGRERETAWIKQNGHKYRGKWIALDENHLIGFAPTLKELLVKLNTRTERETVPFVLKLMSG